MQAELTKLLGETEKLKKKLMLPPPGAEKDGQIKQLEAEVQKLKADHQKALAEKAAALNVNEKTHLNSL